MNPGDDHELRLLHNERRWLLSERRGTRPRWSQERYDEIRERIDALEMAAEFGLTWHRRELIRELKIRYFRLLIEHATRLLGRTST